jgi:acyl dehydratase
MARSERLTPRKLKAFLGKEIGTSEWSSITQERIDAFAGCTEDRQWIHVDRERTAQGPLGSTVAQGFLLLSLLPHFLQTNELFQMKFKMVLNYGLDRVRFINPVRPGDRIRNRAVLREIKRKGFRRVLIKIENTMEVEGRDEPAMVAELLAYFFL